MSATNVIYLVVLGLCVGASGFFSGSETALVGIPKERVHQLADSRRGRRLEALVAEPERMLSTLLIANNFVNILGASVATILFISLIGESWGPWTATLVVTAVVLLFGEITPKTLATRHPVTFSLYVAPTIWRLSLVLRPIARVFEAAARLLFRILRIRDAEGPKITEEDIRAMAVLGEREGEIDAAEREIIHSLFHLADRPVRDVMTPRVDVVTLSHPLAMSDVRLAIAATGHSRLPVIREDLDDLVGVLFVKDVLPLPDDASSDEIHTMLREPFYVPESKPVLSLLQEMRQRRYAFAVVTDEHGGVEGVVTIKDLVSELVGELQDEYDPGTPTIVRVAPTQWVADGRVTVEELSTSVGHDLPTGAYSSAGGLYLNLAGRIPAPGDTVRVDGLVLTVISMDRHRIDRLRVDVAEPDAVAEGADQRTQL